MTAAQEEKAVLRMTTYHTTKWDVDRNSEDSAATIRIADHTVVSTIIHPMINNVVLFKQ
jgi:hypothetical protein